jgi:hypothetical protein
LCASIADAGQMKYVLNAELTHPETKP